MSIKLKIKQHSCSRLTVTAPQMDEEVFIDIVHSTGGVIGQTPRVSHIYVLADDCALYSLSMDHHLKIKSFKTQDLDILYQASVAFGIMPTLRAILCEAYPIKRIITILEAANPWLKFKKSRTIA